MQSISGTPTGPQLVWEVTWQGPQTGIFLKKLERLLQVTVQPLLRERYTLNGKKLERAVFCIELGCGQWETAVMQTLQQAGKLTAGWQVIIVDADHCIRGRLPTAAGFSIHAPAGLHAIGWTLTRDANQTCDRMTATDQW